MKRFRLLIAFPAAVALAVSVAVSAGPVVGAQAAPAKLPVITAFTRNHFPESLAIDGQGNLYASLDYIGQVVKVTPGGQQQLVASLDVGAGFLTGLAIDPSGNLYVADATFEASPTPPGVFRIGAGGGVTRVATLPAGSFPNGLAFHDGSLYISDSSLGVIWRLPPGGKPGHLAEGPAARAEDEVWHRSQRRGVPAGQPVCFRVGYGNDRAGAPHHRRQCRYSGGRRPVAPAADRRRHRV